MKKCCKCQEFKPLVDFHNNKSNKDGKAKRCRLCESDKSKREYRDGKRSYKRKNRTLMDRFEPKYVPVTESGCWLWIGTTEAHGYGIISIKGRPVRAHRVSWVLHNGDIPEGLCVLHKCDTPGCVNPNHLFIGTPADNHADMMAKGRNRSGGGWKMKGSQHKKAKLTENDVLTIRSLKGVKSNRQLATDYNVSCAAIFYIMSRRNWRHI